MEIKKVSEKGKSFQVTHTQIEVSKDKYLSEMSTFNDPYGQTALQHFMVNYLEKNRDDGLIGLVRYKDQGEKILIDAAVRYME